MHTAHIIIRSTHHLTCIAYRLQHVKLESCVSLQQDLQMTFFKHESVDFIHSLTLFLLPVCLVELTWSYSNLYYAGQLLTHQEQ